jgi:hypothetical protein
MTSVTYGLNHLAIGIRAAGGAAFDYFDAFYDRRPGATDRPDLEVSLGLVPSGAAPEPGDRHVTGWGVTIDRLAPHRFLVAPTDAAGVDEEEVYSTARRLVRHFWFDRFARRHRHFVLHASAVDDGARVIAFTGDKRSGKTTMLLDSLAGEHGRLVTNDNLLVFEDGESIIATCTPTYVKIRQDTVLRFGDFLRARAAGDGVNRGLLARYQSDPFTFGPDGSLLLTFGAFGSSRMPATSLRDRELVIVDCAFASDGRVRIDETDAAGRADEFIRHNLKTEEAVRSMIGGRLYPASSLSTPDTAAELVDATAARARLVTYRHAGEVAPLLAHLRGTPALEPLQGALQ